MHLMQQVETYIKLYLHMIAMGIKALGMSLDQFVYTIVAAKTFSQFCSMPLSLRIRSVKTSLSEETSINHLVQVRDRVR